MILRYGEVETLTGADVVVIGSGPAGLALALALEDHGHSVLVLESGEAEEEPFSRSLSSGHHFDENRHAAPSVSSRRAIGGSSDWWGGRCVPYDDIDFEPRSHIPNSGWPFAHVDLAAYAERAADFFGIDRSAFRAPVASWSGLKQSELADLERWTPEVNMATLHLERLKASSRITVVTGATVVGVEAANGQVRAIQIASATRREKLDVNRLVIAAGGVETIRLVMASGLSESAWLGKGYMGHISGKIADLVLANPADFTQQNFFADGNHYARRRFTFPAEVQRAERLPNISLWADNPAFYRHQHRSGILSGVWMAMALPFVGRKLVSEGVRISHAGPKPYRWGAHILNIVRNPIDLLTNAFRIVEALYIKKPRQPGFLIRTAGGRYALHYHSEQMPDASSQVSLLETIDATGVPYADIDLRHLPEDAEMILKAHEVLDNDLRQAGLGHLEFHHDSRTDRLASIKAQAADGFHQIGGLRMGKTASEGVVDPDGQVYGTKNLYAASSAIFPTAGQANPTWLIAVLALRLADHLAASMSSKGDFSENGLSQSA